MRSSEQTKSSPFSFTFLGTGTSVGIPVIGCPCKVCHSENPHNTRTRSSAFVEFQDLAILIDSGPDLREQALREGLTKVDSVLYTHPHVDHVAGFDELRAFCWHREAPLPLYSSASCLDTLRTMFPWAFDENKHSPGYVRPAPRTFDAPIILEGLIITPLPVIHAQVETLGFRFDADEYKSIAYISDVKEIPDETFALLAGVDILIIDALRYDAHTTHMSVAEALSAASRSGANEIWLTHIAHEIDAEDITLPANVQLAYDGLTLNL